MKRLCMISIMLCVLLTGCGKDKVEQQAPVLLEPVSVNVDTAYARKENMYEIMAYPAKVIPYTEKLSFHVSGDLDQLKVGLGHTVKEGEVLATLDESNLLSQIEMLESAIASTIKINEYNNELAKLDIKILKLELSQLEESAHTQVEKVRLDEIKLDIKIKKADIAIAEKKLSQGKELQEYELEKPSHELNELSKKVGKNKIIAPCSGQIVYTANVTEGDNLEEDRIIVVVADPSRPLVESEYISERVIESSYRYYALLDNKEYVVTNVPMETDEYLKAILSEVTLTSTFMFDQIDEDIRIGSYSSICIEKNYKENVLVIPSKALYKDSSGNYVYLMNGDIRNRQPVEVGITNQSNAEIISGIEEGDEVYVKN